MYTITYREAKEEDSGRNEAMESSKVGMDTAEADSQSAGEELPLKHLV